ncbi:hypothetical protein M231_00617 [Tremella mesenterica]|uniref:RING-type domain-containing protein n=1 Tax=Tremella mesenterica TaxID=5217 RepID=A0A4V1M512_TREME|nr:hypothetical protein M231_00617 [Tremella mesenterica]
MRPRFERSRTSQTLRGVSDPFQEGSTISVNQPVGSLSISPSSRDVCLASRKGLYILDLANLNNTPRFIPQGGTWQIADCQWSPHPSTSNLILSTSSQKLLVWDLSAPKALHSSIDAHSRAITDINWHARDPNLMATVSMDAGIRGWDLRTGDIPFMRLCAWGAAGTQVKWNRQHEHILATAHGKEVVVWDTRKGSVPVVSIKAHDSKIYGIDWDRQYRNKIVTCSLDKKIKFWTVPELGGSVSTDDFYPIIPAPSQPTAIISTPYPVWRARNLPFGHGVLALPQRGEKSLQMFGMDSQVPVETFEGHDDVVKEFVWRSRGGDDLNFEDREFQLVTWSKDRTLRIWPVGSDITERVGYKYGDPIEVLISRRGAADITYTQIPDENISNNVPKPILQSGIAKLKPTKPEAGMTRGGGKVRGMDQLEWLTKVVENKASPESSMLQSRLGSLSRPVSRPQSTEGKFDWMSLKDEVIMVSKLFSRQKINFEKIDLNHRKLTISVNGPWANGDRMAFMRIHWSFPSNYPFSEQIPTFELESNPTISTFTRTKIVTTIKELRAEHRQCLISTIGFLIGAHARGRRAVTEDSESESDEDINIGNDVPMLRRISGATFGPNGQLVCFFPKQTVLPRTRATSRSPSVPPNDREPLARAMSALAHLENPRLRSSLRAKARLLRITPPVQVQAGSTMTIHDVSFLGNPDANLAAVYGMDLQDNLLHAIQHVRLDHAEIWATLKGLLNEPPPPYSQLPPLERPHDPWRERALWEQAITHRRAMFELLLVELIKQRDFQMIALISCIALSHMRSNPPPPLPRPEPSPVQDYFTLPPSSSNPIRKRSGLTFSGHISPGRSIRNSAFSALSSFSQMATANSSTFSLRGSLGNPTPPLPPNSIQGAGSGTVTPKDKTSFDVTFPSVHTPLGMSYEEHPPIPVPYHSPRHRPPSGTGSVTGASASPTRMTPLKTTSVSASYDSGEIGSLEQKRSLTDRSLPSSAERSHKVSFSDSSFRQEPQISQPNRTKKRICRLRSDFPRDITEGLIGDQWMPLLEAIKLAYCDFLLRCGLFGKRTMLMQWVFVISKAGEVASGDIPLQKSEDSGSKRGDTIVCASCSGKTDQDCSVCHKNSTRPTCAVCRLPIKGLSTGCGICTHRTHASCFRLHFSTDTSSTPTCPACTCNCLSRRGTSIPFLPLYIPPPTSPTLIATPYVKPQLVPISPEKSLPRGLGVINESSVLGLTPTVEVETEEGGAIGPAEDLGTGVSPASPPDLLWAGGQMSTMGQVGQTHPANPLPVMVDPVGTVKREIGSSRANKTGDVRDSPSVL